MERLCAIGGRSSFEGRGTIRHKDSYKGTIRVPL